MNYQEIRHSIAIKIKAMREGQNLSQRELSAISGISQKTISNLEDPNTHTCQLDKLQPIASAFNIEVWELIKPDDSTIAEDSAKKGTGLIKYGDAFDKETIKFAKAFQKLSTKQRAAVQQTVKAFIVSNTPE